MNPWAASGNRAVEKNTPEKSHCGSMTRFISPLTASVVVVRQATSRPMPANARAPDHVDQDHQPEAAADRHLERQGAQEQQHAEVGDQEGQPRTEQGEQEIATGQRRGDQPLEQLADPQVHQHEADAP